VKTLISAFGTAVLFIALVILLSYPTMWLVNYLFSPKFLLFVFGRESFDIWHALWFGVFSGLMWGGNGKSKK
jgi:hypothetical protein